MKRASGMADFKKNLRIRKRLWLAADLLRANTGLTAQEYSRPILGLIFRLNLS